MKGLRDITIQEWGEYNWIDISRMIDEDPIYIRGKKLINAPDDGFVYIEVSGPGDSEQRWVRAKTSS